MGCEIVILAAGQGTRMRSAAPKVLQPLAGQPMLAHVIDTARAVGADRLHVVVGVGRAAVMSAFDRDTDVRWVVQQEQLGTGHALQQALPEIGDGQRVLVLLGDVPLVRRETAVACLDAAQAGLGLVTAEFDDPSGLGRIRRDADGRVVAIVEDRDASDAELGIREINSGVMAAEAGAFKRWLANLSGDNAQGELYLTDVVEQAVAEGTPVIAVQAECAVEVTGINDRVQLAVAERSYQRDVATELMRAGVMLRDPGRIDVRGQLQCGRDTEIDVNVVFEGRVQLGEGVRIGAGCYIKDAEIGDGAQIEPQSVIEGAVIAARCQVGPFARLRPGTQLAEDVKIGNFVETKKAILGRRSKASHLAYLGDATIGEDCNIGAGTITCNYDGVSKHPTDIGNNVFVGSNSTLVAPLAIRDDGYVAAGSTVTTEVDAGALAIGRARQRNIEGWTRPANRGSENRREH